MSYSEGERQSADDDDDDDDDLKVNLLPLIDPSFQYSYSSDGR